MPDLMGQSVQLAKKAVERTGAEALEPRHFLAGIAADAALSEGLLTGLSLSDPLILPPEIEKLGRELGDHPTPGDKIALGPVVKPVYQELYKLHDGQVPFVAFMKALMELPADPAMQEIRRLNPSLAEVRLLKESESPTNLDRIMGDVLAVQNILSRKVVGQQDAVQQIADAIFQAKISARDDQQSPQIVLLFLGPPGVGKTYTAQLLGEALTVGDKEAFLRLDMSAFADHEGFRGLVGFEPSYQGARPGILTEFGKEHPEGLILVDEVEKSHTSVQNLLLQLLDYGILEDKFTREKISFAGNIVAFTTNLGRELYSTSLGGSISADEGNSRPAVLEALSGATHPMTGLPVLRPELVSRLAKGYPILFKHLTPMALEEIAALALSELAVELELQLGLSLQPVDERILTLLIQRLGPDLDARSLTAGVPLTVKDAIRTVLSERRTELFGEKGNWERVRNLVLDLPRGDGGRLLDTIYNGGDRFLMISSNVDQESLGGRFPELAWSFAKTSEFKEALRRNPPEIALIDLSLEAEDAGAPAIAPAARLIRKIREVQPELPLYIFSSRPLVGGELERTKDRLLRNSGARGFLVGDPKSWETGEKGTLAQIRLSVLRERYLREAFRTRQTANFQWDVSLDFEGKEGTLSLRPIDLHIKTVVASKDRTARLTFTGIPSERFSDLAGGHEAKRRLREILTWMRNPEALRSLGIRLPAGILLEGPPGNGKTLLARATAGEAGLPFFAVSATDFASKWVGESESNIRELFERAAMYAPSIVFIDEIDAIAGQRGASQNSVHDSMLNQLLVSMDGFSERDKPVFFLAATNRSDILDPALKRPGRFDLIITVGNLDVEARLELLKSKTAQLPLAKDVDLGAVARSAMGLSGAQLARAVQEAAILALRQTEKDGRDRDLLLVTMEQFREAVTTVRYGLRIEGALPPETEMRRTAVHEAGHAIIGELERAGSVHQATILPRGRALGFVESLPESEFASITVSGIRSRIRTALAGRGAEIIAFGVEEVSAGCSQDLAVATQVATLAVSRYGMSSTVGPVSILALRELLPEGTSVEAIQTEVESMLRQEEQNVQRHLEENRDALEAVATLLIEHESVPGDMIRQVLGRNATGVTTPKLD
ncbi:MAG: AAA family ATPase [Thermoanaerobaculales bacterium]|nr:AAA family ATPase [Thermoanaerobaculales bacterium]